MASGVTLWGEGNRKWRADLGEASAEAGEHLPHVSSFLHADDTQMILLVHPNQECLIVIVPAGE